MNEIWRRLERCGILLGLVVVLSLGLFGMLLLNIWDSGGPEAQARAVVVQTIVLLGQAVVLAITAVFVVLYAVAAQTTARASKALVNATLKARTTLFVTDPIWTVKEYPAHLNEHAWRKTTHNEEQESAHDYEVIKPREWLAIEIVNEGNFRAVNITLVATWVPDSDVNSQ